MSYRWRRRTLSVPLRLKHTKHGKVGKAGRVGRTRMCRALCTCNGKQEDNMIITCILKELSLLCRYWPERVVGQEAQDAVFQGWKWQEGGGRKYSES